MLDDKELEERLTGIDADLAERIKHLEIDDLGRIAYGDESTIFELAPNFGISYERLSDEDKQAIKAYAQFLYNDKKEISNGVKAAIDALDRRVEKAVTDLGEAVRRVAETGKKAWRSVAIAAAIGIAAAGAGGYLSYDAGVRNTTAVVETVKQENRGLSQKIQDLSGKLEYTEQRQQLMDSVRRGETVVYTPLEVLKGNDGIVVSRPNKGFEGGYGISNKSFPPAGFITGGNSFSNEDKIKLASMIDGLGVQNNVPGGCVSYQLFSFGINDDLSDQDKAQLELKLSGTALNSDGVRYQYSKIHVCCWNGLRWVQVGEDRNDISQGNGMIKDNEIMSVYSLRDPGLRKYFRNEHKLHILLFLDNQKSGNMGVLNVDYLELVVN